MILEWGNLEDGIWNAEELLKEENIEPLYLVPNY